WNRSLAAFALLTSLGTDNPIALAANADQPASQKNQTPVFDPRAKKPGPIAPKLERIVLDEVMFDGVPLAEVLRFLDEESRKSDPEKKAINFLINAHTTSSAPVSLIDPQTGQAFTLPPTEPMEMNSVI